MDISVVYYLLIETKFLVLPTLKKKWSFMFMVPCILKISCK